MALFLDTRVGDILYIGDMRIEVLHKSGRAVRLKITGDAPVDLVRAPPPPGAPQQQELQLEGTHGRST